MTTNIQLLAKFSMMMGYSPSKLSVLKSAIFFETILEMAKEKVKYGLQNDREIVAVLDRTEKKMKTVEVFFFFFLFSLWVDRLISLLKSTIILDIMFFTATLFSEICSIIQIWKTPRILLTLLQE